jgi:hypothetical protein
MSRLAEKYLGEPVQVLQVLLSAQAFFIKPGVGQGYP